MYLDEEEKPTSKYLYRIKAKGYADVVIPRLNFKHRSWDDTASVDPVLYIVMQTHQFETVGNTIRRIESYQIKKPIDVKDTVIFKMPITSKDPLKSNVETVCPIKSYPNPVVEKMNVDFTDAPHGGNAYVIRNYLGQELKTGVFTKAQNELDLHSLKTGNYTLEIKDESGNIRYLNKFIKAK